MHDALTLIRELRSAGASSVHVRYPDLDIKVDWEGPPPLVVVGSEARPAQTTPAPSTPEEPEHIERGHVLIRQERLDELEEKARRYDALDSFG